MMNSSAITTSSILFALVALFSASSGVNGQYSALFGNDGDDAVSNSTEIVDVEIDDEEEDGEETCKSITSILCTEGNNLNALCEAISISELNDDLAEDAWTIFAPNDEAFQALGRDNLDSLVFGNNTVALTDLLLFHIIPGVSLTSDLLPCEAGDNLSVMANGEDSRTICNGRAPPYAMEQRGQYNDKEDAPAFLETDIVACNGVIHILDKVMLYEALPFDIPEEIEEDEGDETDLEADELMFEVEEHEDDEDESSSSIDASSTSHSTDAPSDLGNANTVVVASGSVEEAPACQTITELACSDSDFSIACGLLKDTGLSDDLNDGLWTVFAPNNAAFNEAPRFSSDTDIEFILQGHIVANAEIASGDLECTEKIEMVNGKNTRTVCRGEAIYQKGSGNSDEQRPEIIDADIVACNGILHIVDQVILS